MRAALARQLQHITKARGGDHTRARPFTFEHGVGGERSAQHQKRHILARNLVLIEQLGNAIQNAARGITRGGGHLVVVVTPAVEISSHQIGEGAAGVYAYEDFAHAELTKSIAKIENYISP